MRIGVAFLAAGLTVGAQAQTIITQWNFNGDSAATVPGGTSSPTPSIGAGTASLLSTTATFASGIASGGSSDTTPGSPPNYAWNTTTYAAQGTENGQRGVRFDVSTTGFFNVQVRFDTRHSNTASRWLRFDYTKNGGTDWILGTKAANTVFVAGSGGDAWYNLRSVDLTTDLGVNNNPNFGFRVVSIFGPDATSLAAFDDTATYSQYFASTTTSTYGTSGTLRYDAVTVSGVVPDPATISVLGMGLLGLAAKRRKK